jgi:hypothetical protein
MLTNSHWVGAIPPLFLGMASAPFAQFQNFTGAGLMKSKGGREKDRGAGSRSAMGCGDANQRF